MRRDECGEATRTTGNRGTWLHDSLSELEQLQTPQDHAGITVSGFGKRVHLFLVGRNEDRRATTVRDMADGGALVSLMLRD